MPQFERFVGFTDLFDYVEFWLKEKETFFTLVDVSVCEFSALIFKIDLETIELVEEIERICGNECFTYGYREEYKMFFGQDKDKNVTTK